MMKISLSYKQLYWFLFLSLTLQSYENNQTTIEETSRVSVLFLLLFILSIFVYFIARYIFALRKSQEELQAYIDELEDRVAQEVEKNTIHQQQLFNQTRLAQMGEMISMIAHQWRQALGLIAATSIDMKIKLELQTYDLSDEKQREKYLKYFDKSLSNIESFTQSLTRTIDDFRDIYKHKRVSSRLKLNLPIQKALNIVRGSSSVNGLIIIEEYAAQKELLIFEGELIQVILNIIKNAEENFKIQDLDKPTIWIETKEIERGVILNICDNGGGVREEIINKIFDPYFSTKYDRNGTGLGLYMSKMIIENHHQGILRAKNIDDGICFSIELKGEE